MISTFIPSDGTEQKVWIRLTPSERAAYRRAWLYSFCLLWKTPAELMGPELDEIISGHRPERYIYLTDWTEP